MGPSPACSQLCTEVLGHGPAVRASTAEADGTHAVRATSSFCSRKRTEPVVVPWSPWGMWAAHVDDFFQRFSDSLLLKQKEFVWCLIRPVFHRTAVTISWPGPDRTAALGRKGNHGRMWGTSKKKLSPLLIHFPAALSSCWPARFNSCPFLCISQFLVCLKVYSFLNVSVPVIPCRDCSLSLLCAGLAAPLEAAVCPTLPGPATCPVLSFQTSSRSGRGESWITARPCSSAARTDQLSAGLLNQAGLVYVPSYPSPGSLDRCQNPWGNFLPQELHQQTTPLQFLCDQCLSGKSPPLFTPWLAYRCIIYNLTDLTFFTSCSMKQPPILLKAVGFLIQK